MLRLRQMLLLSVASGLLLLIIGINFSQRKQHFPQRLVTNNVPETPSLILNATGVYFPLRHGTGNQLFTFACAFATAKRLKTKLYLRTGWNTSNSTMSRNPQNRENVLPFLNLPEDVASDLPIPEYVKTAGELRDYLSKSGVRTRWLQGKELISSTSWGKVRKDLLLAPQTEGPLLYTTESYCWGEGFFSPFKKEILQLLNLQKIREWTEETEAGSVWLRRIRMEKNPVMVHIRKGDYVTLTYKPSHLLPISYYINGMQLMRDILGDNATFFIFSDSMELTKKELHEVVKFAEFKDKVHFVSSGELPNLVEFYLMTECSSGIMSRSTFSWWAAYLMRGGMGGEVVVTPKGIPEWWENAAIVPSSWIVLE